LEESIIAPLPIFLTTPSLTSSISSQEQSCPWLSLSFS